MTGRQKFVGFVLQQLHKPALWGAKGPDAFDCSGLVSYCLHAVGGPDLTATHNAQHLFDETMPLPESIDPLPGDLIFFGPLPTLVEHVAIFLAGAHAIDAAGATPHIKTLEDAKLSGTNVRTHDQVRFRVNFRGIHRNYHLDALDLVCR